MAKKKRRPRPAQTPAAASRPLQRNIPVRIAAATALPAAGGPPRRLVWGEAGLTGVAALAVYLLTASPGLATGDSGELIAAAWTLGVAHPPGYPLYTALGFLITHLSFGDAAL